MSKYHSQKITVDGETFDSKKEFNRCCELRLLQRAGEISGLRRQVKFVLLPAQYIELAETYKSGPHKGEPKTKLAERECAYYADFVYTDKSGETIVEDVKGVRTPEYKIKRKLMLAMHGIRIKEV